LRPAITPILAGSARIGALVCPYHAWTYRVLVRQHYPEIGEGDAITVPLRESGYGAGVVGR